MLEAVFWSTQLSLPQPTKPAVLPLLSTASSLEVYQQAVISTSLIGQIIKQSVHQVKHPARPETRCVASDRLVFITYLLRPHRSVFQALVRDGSTCQEAPDLSGPIMNHLKEGRWSMSSTSKKSSLNISGTLYSFNNSGAASPNWIKVFQIRKICCWKLYRESSRIGKEPSRQKCIEDPRHAELSYMTHSPSVSS